MTRYQIAIDKQDQYFSLPRGCSCIDGCWRMDSLCFYTPDFRSPLARLLEEGMPERVKIEIPNKRSESEKWKTTTAKIKSTAFVARIDSSQISGMQRPPTEVLNSLRQSMRTKALKALMSAYGDFSLDTKPPEKQNE